MQDDELIKAFAEIAQKVGALSVHIARAWVCDHCKDGNKEAHPYGVDDKDGNYWDVLCNECYDKLGCAHSEVQDDEFETPMMECPICGAEYEDHDGFGVVYCEACGYCQHISATGNIMECPICGAEYEDHDGFGVVYCEACGYCQHISATGNICDLCGNNLENLREREEPTP